MIERSSFARANGKDAGLFDTGTLGGKLEAQNAVVSRTVGFGCLIKYSSVVTGCFEHGKAETSFPNLQ